MTLLEQVQKSLLQSEILGQAQNDTFGTGAKEFVAIWDSESSSEWRFWNRNKRVCCNLRFWVKLRMTLLEQEQKSLLQS